MIEKDCVKIQSAVLIVALALFAFLGALTCRKAPGRKSGAASAVTVEVRGEGVPNPGIYILDKARATVGAACAKAGLRSGISEPLARRKLVSGQSLEVVGQKRGVAIKFGRMPGAALLACGLKLDLNSAPPGDLLLVPHLRPSIVAAIVTRRSQKSWASVSDLVELRGVGPKTVQKLSDYLEVPVRDGNGKRR